MNKLTSDQKVPENILSWVPEEIKQIKLGVLFGQYAIEFPAIYFSKYRMHRSPLWENLRLMDEIGLVLKTAPDHLILGLIEELDKENFYYRVYKI